MKTARMAATLCTRMSRHFSCSPLEGYDSSSVLHSYSLYYQRKSFHSANRCSNRRNRIRGMRATGGSGGSSGSGGTVSTTRAVHESADTMAYESLDGVPRICVVGGGFGGLYTAIKLEQLMWPRGVKPRVVLVDQNDRFSFKPLLYDVLTESATSDEVAPLYSSMLAPYSVSFVQGTVCGIEGGQVVLQDGEKISYDWLVMALGAKTNSFGVPGVEEYALQFSVYEDAVRLQEELKRVTEEKKGKFPEICIVGGGYAGVELAAALSDRLGGACQIRLVTSGGDIMEPAPYGQRQAARNVLDSDGVSIMCNTVVERIQIAGGDEDGSGGKKIIQAKRLDNGTKDVLEADIVVWTAGQVPAVKEYSNSIPFPTDDYGSIKTDRTLRVVGTETVFALGDVAVRGMDGMHLPATAQVAFQQADYVAWNIWSSINKKPLLNFQYQHLGDMMSLGSTKGAVSLPIPVPPPISAAIKQGPLGDVLKAVGVSVNTTFGGASDGITIEGPFGALLRRAAYLYRQPTDEQKVQVIRSWAKKAGIPGPKKAS